MYPLSDKDLDRLSREAAEQYDVESSASGWEQVEKKLNKVMPEQKERKRRFAWLLLLLVFLAGSGLSGILYFSNRKASGESTNTTNIKQESGTISQKEIASANDQLKAETSTVNWNQKKRIALKTAYLKKQMYLLIPLNRKKTFQHPKTVVRLTEKTIKEIQHQPIHKS